MGRPRKHDERMAGVLLDTAERLVDAGGLGALSVRAIADQASTTTRAVYSLFGSKAGLIAALGARTFNLLGAGVQALPITDRPAEDLVDAGVSVFRQLAITRPALFQVGVQRTAIDVAITTEFLPAARAAFEVLESRFALLAEAGQLPERSTGQAACQFDALCEGLAALELRGSFRPESAEAVWRDALSALITGMSTPPAHPLSNPSTGWPF